jgi:hypothetical protein
MFGRYQIQKDDRGVMGDVTQMKATFDLIDRWRVSNQETRSFSWEGTTGSERKRSSQLRIHRKYTTKLTRETANEFKMINCDVSDHDGDSVTIREATAPITAKGEQNRS